MAEKSFSYLLIKLRELVEQDEAYMHLDEDAYDMVALYTKSTELLDMKSRLKEGEGTDMCKAIREMMEDSRAEGRAEGRIEGYKAVVTMCQEFGLSREQTIQQLMEKCSLDRETAVSMMAV